MSADELADALRPLWEDAPPLARALCGRHFETWEDLIGEAERLLRSGPDEWRSEVLRAHPRLGESRPRLKARSRWSWSEQGGNRPDEPGTAARLDQLNRRYEERFGFPFVEWVGGRPLEQIADVMEQRLANQPSEELDKGSAALVAIARDRLRRIQTGDPTPS